MNVTKPRRYVDFERGNAALFFLVTCLSENIILDCITEGGNAISFILWLLKIPVTILTVCFPSSLANQSYCKPLLLSWKVRVYPECELSFSFN